MGNPYLASAYVFAALLFGLYAWNLSRRQAQLRKDLDDLKKKLPGQASPGTVA